MRTREAALGKVLDGFANTTALLADERQAIQDLVKNLASLSTTGLDLTSEHAAKLDHDLTVLTRTLQSAKQNIGSVPQPPRLGAPSGRRPEPRRHAGAGRRVEPADPRPRSARRGQPGRRADIRRARHPDQRAVPAGHRQLRRAAGRGAAKSGPKAAASPTTTVVAKAAAVTAPPAKKSESWLRRTARLVGRGLLVRRLVALIAVAAVATPLLAACGGGGTTITATFDDVGDLQPRGSVQVADVRGRADRQDLASRKDFRARVKLSLNPGVKVPRASTRVAAHDVAAR